MAKEDEDTLPDRDSAREFYIKYEPQEILGRGISSLVRRCMKKETGIEYAVKIIDITGNDQDPAGNGIRSATFQEVDILRMVSGHPNIIELHEVFETDTFFFLVFELCKNGELFDYLTTKVTVSEKRTRLWMKQLLEALDYVHSMGIVHRDVKPENILLDDDFNLKLTDFGFAKIIKPNEKLFDLCGTPGYLAPELLKASMYDDAAGYSLEVDVWACGVIMYTFLGGCPPFWHRKQMIMLRNIMEGKYCLDTGEWSTISELPKNLIRQFLVIDPSQRITTEIALSHEFFQGAAVAVPVKKFNAKRKFKAAIHCVCAAVRIRRLRFTPESLMLYNIMANPYRIQQVRKIIDLGAFMIYSHWVKKSEAQNRAALFEVKPRREVMYRTDSLKTQTMLIL